MNNAKVCKPVSPSKTGFALVVTLTLMVLLSILALGMLSLSAVSLRSERGSSNDQIARANARLGLMAALNQLQTQMGPDQRISARAESFAADPEYGVTVSEKTPGAMWVGAAVVTNALRSPGSQPPTFPDGKKVDWLVSGVTGTTLGDSALNNPVNMFTDKSIDLTKYTGGAEIRAGRVAIRDKDNALVGNYAYFTDDEGMKAQLAPSNPKARNSANAGKGMLAAGYDLGELQDLEDLKDIDSTLLQKAISLSDLQLIGTTPEIASEKHFDFTTRSRGILSDTRNGGLRKDLTIAFEKDDVFIKVFPKTNKEKFLLLHKDRLPDASDLSDNGYINWEIFKDYYNMKRNILGGESAPYMDHIMFSKLGFFNDTQSGAFYRGEQGPHEMKPGGNHAGIPYGDFEVMETPGGKMENYKHSPFSPVLAQLQMNAWVEPKSGMVKKSATDPTLVMKYWFRSRTQLWTSHYNPYNIPMRILSTNGTGPRIMNFPQAVFRIPKYTSNPVNGFNNKRQTSASAEVRLQPGRSHVLGLDKDATGGAENDSGPYSERVQAIVGQSVYYDSDKTETKPTGDIKVEIDYVMNRSSLMHGCNEDPKNVESAQIFFTPIAVDEARFIDDQTFPGKKFEYTVPITDLSVNNRVSIMMALRPTTQGGGSIRPLVDSNIRCMFGSPKWDGALKQSGVPQTTLAAYELISRDPITDNGMQMSFPDAPKGYSFWGNSRSPAGFDRVILFDVPRDDLVSLGQLQHAGAGRFSYEPSYIAGNSYANPRIPQTEWKTSTTDSFSTSAPGAALWKIGGSFNLYDASFLVNEAMWDSYVFTTIPQEDDNFSGNDVPANFPGLLAGDILLPNPRFMPYEPQDSKFDTSTLQDEGTDKAGSFFHNAGHLLVDGSFNVHSTSVDAWEAFLSGTKGLPIQKMEANGSISGFDSGIEKVRFPRVKSNFGEGYESGTNSDDFWTGFRELEQTEVRELAEAIVAENKRRGPYRGMAEFVNRKLKSGPDGASGAIQSALDGTVNLTVNSGLSDSATHPKLPADQKQAAAFPGQLIQGDILQALGPYMSVRSDSFTIRAYGEALDPKSSNVLATAWCEATVQRLPDPVSPATAAPDPKVDLANPTSPFGRRFVIRTFRWLNREEV